MTDLTTTFDMAAHEKAASEQTKGVSLSGLQLSSKQLQVFDDESNVVCLELRNQCGTVEKRIEEYWAPLAEMANKLHKSITGKRGEMMKPWSDLKAIFNKKSGDWMMAQRRAKAAAEQELAQLAQQQQRELQRQADELMQRGFVAEAQAKTTQAAIITTPTLPDAVTKVAGSRIGFPWNATGVDLMATIKAIAGGKTPLMWDSGDEAQEPLLIFNQKLLNAIAKRSQGTLTIPGVKFEEGVRIGSAKL